MPKPTPKAPAAAIAAYEKLIATIPGVQKKGAAAQYTSLNGHMFSFLTDDGDLAVRIGKKRRAAYLEVHPDAIAVAYETVMKEYVLLPRAEMTKKAGKALFAEAHAYVAALKPNPTKKKAATKKAATKKAATKKAKR